jgi:hypothetical protein
MSFHQRNLEYLRRRFIAGAMEQGGGAAGN